MVGPDFQPEPYIVDEYKRARNHRHYLTARLVTLHDLYHSTPMKGRADDFTDIIGRSYQATERRAGLDSSPSAAYVAHQCCGDTFL